MKKILIITGLMFMMILNVKIHAKDNPLLKPFDTPFGVPPFDKIKNEHFKPAFETAIKKHDEEIKQIAESKSLPTFENTVEALELSGDLLNDVSTIFYNLNSANTNPELQGIAKDIAPKLSEHNDNILLNASLFKKIKTVYDNRKNLRLNNEQSKLLEETYRNFVKSGANLNEQQKAKLREINQKMSLLTLKFGENILKETNSFQLVIDNEKDLSGLPQSIIDGAKDAAKSKKLDGKWLFTLHNPSVMPFLQYSSNRELRKKIQQAYINRGNNGNEFDNKKIIEDIVKLRTEKAQLLGYQSYADFVLDETMAKTPAKVYELLNRLWEPAIKVAKNEAKELQSMIDREGGKFKLEAYDWRYYAEKLRKEKYDLDEEEIRPYLKLENVRDGIFELTKRLYGITYKVRTDIPKYHEDAVVYEVIDKDGSHLGILYMDFHPRESKRGGAWMTNYREQHFKNGQNVTPVVSLVCNFSKPSGNTPSLLTWDETETFFHEFGHGLHGLFSKCHYRSLAGTNVPRDFVELPSQIMENWVAEPEVLSLFAKHYKTGEIMPKSLIEKLQKSSLFNQGFTTVEYLAAAIIDMKYHDQKSPLSLSVPEFEQKSVTEMGLITEIVLRYRSTYFNHIFAGGYSAGYYSYIWSGVLDTDAFQAFKETGLFNSKTAESFRRNVLERGKTDEPMNLYKNFRGAEPSIEPLLKKRGLNIPLN